LPEKFNCSHKASADERRHAVVLHLHGAVFHNNRK
jgi:hypothetical protein